ncbi:hypothetical protein V6N13_102718 [Hibiscus sabdariffa]
MVRFPGRSAALRVLSISLRAFRLRISTLTLELLSIFTYGLLLFFDFFSALTFDFIVATRFSNWLAIFPIRKPESKATLISLASHSSLPFNSSFQ